MTVGVLWFFLTLPWPWVGLQFVNVVLPDHTHLPFFYFDTVYAQLSSETTSLLFGRNLHHVHLAYILCAAGWLFTVPIVWCKVVLDVVLVWHFVSFQGRLTSHCIVALLIR